MKSLPAGTVTFLFTDIEGSTRLLHQLGDRYADVLATHHRLLRAAIQDADGHEMDSQGDALFVAFPRAKDALLAAVAAQRAVQAHPWPDGITVRVRMGLHTGEPLRGETGYIGMDVHRAARIAAAGHGGQILLSDTTSALVTKDLPDWMSLRDLGEHRLKDLAHPHRLFQVVAADLPADFPTIKSLDALPNNLPVQLTSFIGRERERAEVRRLLSSTRFLTLTGSGGAGKTRLALQVAAEALEEFPDGVWLVELAVLSDPTLVPKAVASALGVPEQPGRSLAETLTDALRAKSALCILDNCEHLVAACAHLTDALLRASPNVRILATSREVLGVTGETTWRIPSLSLPDPQRLPPLDRFTEYEAIRLFLDRAAASAPEFTLTSRNAPAVAQVCHRLDGIPLAIELAAARVKVLAVEQIAARLDDRFRLLTGGSRTAVPRQQTLRAAMDWSYDLLSEKERALLRRLAVFGGGWTLKAAEALCAGGGGADQVLDLLTSLVDKSLVMVEKNHGEARYRLLETLRQYAWDQLVEAGEATEAQRQHRAWYLDLAERAEAGIEGPEDTMWLNRLEVEHDNLRAALGWSSTGKDDGETGLRLAAALYWFWECHTHWGEGRKWLETALAGSRNVKSTAGVKALWEYGNLAWMQGDYATALALCDQSLALGRELGDKAGIARALVWRGLVALRQEDFDTATALFEEGLDLSRTLEDKWFTAIVLAQMGAMARLKGDYVKAVALCEESLGMFRTLGGPRWIAYSLRLMGRAVRLQGDLQSAVGLYQEGLALLRKTRDKWIATECIEGLAIIASMKGEHARAACLSGAAEAARETFGITMPRPERGNQGLVTTTGEGLEDETSAAAWAEGRAMTLEQAIEYALAGEAN